MNKNAYLFAAALVAGTMGMTSCQNEDVAGIEQGVENKVTLSMSVADKFGTRSTAEGVNLGGADKLQTINKIWVVPMIGDALQNPISMGTLNPGEDADKTVEKKTTLNSRVDGFKIYGNVTPDVGFTFNEDVVAQKFTVTATQTTQINHVNMYKPHGLYYYGVAKVGADLSGNRPVGQGNIYAGATSGVMSVLTSGSIGENAYVKVNGVDYAVGVLAAAVLNGDTETPAYTYDQSSSYTEDAKKAHEYISVSGIIINNQKIKLDQDFELVESNTGAIYETAANAAFVTEGNKLNNSNTDDGNLYVVVTETDEDENVSANIEFTLAAGKYIKIGDSEYIGGSEATKFYLPVSLKPETAPSAKAVFMKDYSTFLNATVKNWGMASKTPVEITDVNLAVEIDMTWRQGIVYDVEI